MTDQRPSISATIVVGSVDPEQLAGFGYGDLASSMTTLGIPTGVAGSSRRPAHGFLLLDRIVAGDLIRSWTAQDPESAARTLILNADRSTALVQLEEFGLGGAVTSVRLADWLQDRTDDRHAGIAGLRSVGAALGWPMSSGPVISTDRYAFLFDPAREGLPAEIAHYLTALSEHSEGGLLSGSR